MSLCTHIPANDDKLEFFMNITIRPATPEDVETIVRLEMEFVDYLRTIGDSNPTSLNVNTYLRDGFGEEPAFSGIVAETNGEVVGYMFYHPGYDIDRGGKVIYIVDLFVSEKARRKGAGRALMEMAADICLKAGGSELVWAVFIPNKLAASFYEHLGAKYLQREDMTYMHLRLKEDG